MRIRAASPQDVAALLPLVEAYWDFEGLAGFDPRRLSPLLQRLLSTPSVGLGLIAEEDGGAVGYLLGVYVFSLEHGGMTAEIDELFVDPLARGVGAGEALLTAAEAAFIAAGCAVASLQVGRSNLSGRGFYLRHGYKPRASFEILEKRLSWRDQR